MVSKKLTERTSRPKHVHLNNRLPSENYTNTKENSSSQKLALSWTIRFSDQLLAGSLVEIWQLIRGQQTTNQKYCFSTNQRKNQNLVFEHMIRQVNVSCPPSPCLNTGTREGMIAGFLWEVVTYESLDHSVPTETYPCFKCFNQIRSQVREKIQ